jgi:hypothetical protein
MANNRKRSGKFYSQHEKETMIKLGLTPTIASGSGWLEKEDGHNENLLCQHKSTDAESYRILRTDIDKLEYHAELMHKTPVFAIEFLSDGEIYIMTKLDDIEDVLSYLRIPEKRTQRNVQPQEHTIDVSCSQEHDIKQKQMVKSTNRSKYWNKVNKEREEKKNDSKAR